MAWTTTNLRADLANRIDRGLETGLFKRYAPRSRSHVIEVAVQRFLDEAEKGAA